MRDEVQSNQRCSHRHTTLSSSLVAHDHQQQACAETIRDHIEHGPETGGCEGSGRGSRDLTSSSTQTTTAATQAERRREVDHTRAGLTLSASSGTHTIQGVQALAGKVQRAEHKRVVDKAKRCNAQGDAQVADQVGDEKNDGAAHLWSASGVEWRWHWCGLRACGAMSVCGSAEQLSRLNSRTTASMAAASEPGASAGVVAGVGSGAGSRIAIVEDAHDRSPQLVTGAPFGESESKEEDGPAASVEVPIAAAASSAGGAGGHGGGDAFAFTHVASWQPSCVKDKDTLALLAKWGMGESLAVARFSFSRRLRLPEREGRAEARAAQLGAFLRDAVNDATVKRVVPLGGTPSTGATLASGVTEVAFSEMAVTQTSMSFFDRLEEEGIVHGPMWGADPSGGGDGEEEEASAGGAIKKQFDVVVDGVTCQDELRDALANPDTEHVGVSNAPQPTPGTPRRTPRDLALARTTLDACLADFRRGGGGGARAPVPHLPTVRHRRLHVPVGGQCPPIPGSHAVHLPRAGVRCETPPHRPAGGEERRSGAARGAARRQEEQRSAERLALRHVLGGD